MENQIKIVAIYQATQGLRINRNSTDHREVIKLGVCGDNFGIVKCIETGEEWSTYGYNSLPKVGKFECEMTYKRI